jgi:hypothetical protein
MPATCRVTAVDCRPEDPQRCSRDTISLVKRMSQSLPVKRAVNLQNQERLEVPPVQTEIFAGCGFRERGMYRGF